MIWVTWVSASALPAHTPLDREQMIKELRAFHTLSMGDRAMLLHRNH